MAEKQTQTKGQVRAGYFEDKMAEKGWCRVPGSEGKTDDTYHIVLPMPEGGRKLCEAYRLSNGSVIITRIDLQGHVIYTVDDTCIVFTENGIFDLVHFPDTSAPTSHESEALQCAKLAMDEVCAVA